MAQSTTDTADGNKESKLKCSICSDYFKEPKLLPCLHSFCTSPCLKRLVFQETQGQFLTCPTCKQYSALPDNGLAGLLVDPQLQQQIRFKEAIDRDHCEICPKESTDSKPTKFCPQCEILMCKNCATMHEKWPMFSSHKVLSVDEIKKTLFSLKPVAVCEEHPNVKAKIYCQTCSKLICRDCSQHREHDHKMISAVHIECKEEISSVLTPLLDIKSKMQQALDLCTAKENEIIERKAQIESEFNSKIDQLNQILERRRNAIIGSLECKTQEALKEVATYKNDVKILHKQVSSCVEFTASCLEAGMERKMLQMKVPVVRQIKKITEEFDPSRIQSQNITEMSDIELLSTDLQESCETFGEIVRGPISPQNCYATENETIVAEAETQNSIEIYLQTKQNKPSDQKVDVTFELTHIKTNARVNYFTQPNCTSSTVANYRPATKGKHSLDIKVNEERIQDSPFLIAVVPSQKNLQSPKLIQNLNMPYGIATNSMGELIVAEQQNGCVTILHSSTGKRRRCIGGKFDYPRCVIVDIEDNVYVVDKGSHQIQKFSHKGMLITSVGKGINNLYFASPTGIAFDRAQQLLYVCDHLNHRIQVIKKDLTFVRNFGTEGEGEGQFKSPRCACVDESNSLYVTDFGNNRVQVFTFEGEFIRSFCEKENGETLQQPFAIAIDSSNIVYVSERKRNCISLFTTEGRYIKSFGSSGNEKGEFNKIRGIHIDQNDSIFVCDTKNNRVQIF